jgi:hypothetical protein
MSITFDITDVTTLSSGSTSQRVVITNLNCDSSEIALAQHLSDVIVREVADFRSKQTNTTKGNHA